MSDDVEKRFVTDIYIYIYIYIYIRNSNDDRCARRDMNTEPPDNKLNCCPSLCTTVFNAIYPRQFVTVRALTVNRQFVTVRALTVNRQFVTVRALTVNSHAVCITRTTSILFISLTNYNNFH